MDGSSNVRSRFRASAEALDAFACGSRRAECGTGAGCYAEFGGPSSSPPPRERLPGAGISVSAPGLPQLSRLCLRRNATSEVGVSGQFPPREAERLLPVSTVVPQLSAFAHWSQSSGAFRIYPEFLVVIAVEKGHRGSLHCLTLLFIRSCYFHLPPGRRLGRLSVLRAVLLERWEVSARCSGFRVVRLPVAALGKAFFVSAPALTTFFLVFVLSSFTVLYQGVFSRVSPVGILTGFLAFRNGCVYIIIGTFSAIMCLLKTCFY